MQRYLEELIPRFYPSLDFICIPHEGKSDLQASIPRKLRGWPPNSAKFVIVHDKDRADCRELKNHLRELSRIDGRNVVLVRIACEELEAWHFGDLEALSVVLKDPKIAKLGSRGKYRNPDLISKPSRELGKLNPQFQKVTSAREMARTINPERNRSESFQVLWKTVVEHALTLDRSRQT